MSLQILFGEDEHTASEGAYSRVLKARKWLYASSAGALLLYLGAINDRALSDLLKFIDIHNFTLREVFLGGLIYTLAQYILLCAQLTSTYDLIFKERIQIKQINETNEIIRKVEQTWDDIKGNDAKITRSEIELQDLQRRGNSRASTVETELSIQNITKEKLQAELIRLETQLKIAHASNPAYRPLFVLSEYAIDAIRVVPPLILGVYALYRLVQAN